MATDFRLIAHAAQRHTDILAVGRTRDRLSKRCLADSRRPDKAQNRRLDLVHTLLDSQIFQNTFLDLFQPVMIVVQHPFRIGQIVADLGFFSPWK